MRAEAFRTGCAALVKAPLTFVIDVDGTRNVLTLRFSGVVTVAHIQAAVAEVECRLADVGRRFVAVTDLRDLEAMELDCAPHLARMMDLFRESGVGKVVRLIPDPHKDIGFNILSATHYRGKVKVITCATVAELERALEDGA